MWRIGLAVVLVFSLLAALVLSGHSNAQPPKIARIGVISVGTDPARPGPQWTAFVESLHALGHTEGQNIVIERRFAGGNAERLPTFAGELAQLKVDVMVVTGTREIQAAHQATTTIPIVTVVAPDLVAAGLVTSLARPGGNITGLTFSTSGIGEKYVELLREAVPSATHGNPCQPPTGSGCSEGDARRCTSPQRLPAGSDART